MVPMDRGTPPLTVRSRAYQVAAALSLWQLLLLHAWYGARYSDTALATAHVAAWFTDVLVIVVPAAMTAALGGGTLGESRVARSRA